MSRGGVAVARRAHNPKVVWFKSHPRNHYGGVAQLVRAFGSYPKGRKFEFFRRYHHNLPGPMVKRLRHRPFTAVSGVRFPLGSPSKTNGKAVFFIVAPRGMVAFNKATKPLPCNGSKPLSNFVESRQMPQRRSMRGRLPPLHSLSRVRILSL